MVFLFCFLVFLFPVLVLCRHSKHEFQSYAPVLLVLLVTLQIVRVEQTTKHLLLGVQQLPELLTAMPSLPLPAGLLHQQQHRSAGHLSSLLLFSAQIHPLFTRRPPVADYKANY